VGSGLRLTQVLGSWASGSADPRPAARSAQASDSDRRVMGRLLPGPRGSLAREGPDLDLAGLVGGGEPLAVGRDGEGTEPVLELAAARLAQLLDQLAVVHAPDAHDGIAAGGEQVLAVGVEEDGGGAVEVARGQLAQLLAGGRVEERHLAVLAVDLAAASQGEDLAVGGEGGGGDHLLVELLAQVALQLTGLRVPELDARVRAGVEDERDALGDA